MKSVVLVLLFIVSGLSNSLADQQVIFSCETTIANFATVCTNTFENANGTLGYYQTQCRNGGGFQVDSCPTRNAKYAYSCEREDSKTWYSEDARVTQIQSWCDREHGKFTTLNY